MATIEELNELYQKANYRKVIEEVEKEKLTPGLIEDDTKLLRKGWAYHQLGEYDKSVPIMEELRQRYEPSSEIGMSAREGVAQGLLQWKGDLKAADEVMKEIPPSPRRDNARMNYFLQGARKGLEVPGREIITTITKYISEPPYSTINGHIINNGTFALYEARNQGGVQPYLPILPGLIMIAIDIYEATNTSKNHIAGALFRASKIFEATGKIEKAIEKARASVSIWEELVSSQEGTRFRKNLENARAQLERLTKRE